MARFSRGISCRQHRLPYKRRLPERFEYRFPVFEPGERLYPAKLVELRRGENRHITLEKLI